MTLFDLLGWGEVIALLGMGLIIASPILFVWWDTRRRNPRAYEGYMGGPL